jgi:hypothetical protein
VFGLVYLANNKQRLLQKLEDDLTKAKDRQSRNEIQLAILELRNQAKLYQQCDLLEAEELKNQLLQKINVLSGLGKLGSVEAFRVHLRDVEFHIQTLQIKESMLEKEKDKLDPGEPPNLADRGPSKSSIKKEKKREEAFQHRWMLGMEDEPNLDNK